jgi:hypothetical protein
MTAIAVLFATAFVILLVVRVHFHFSFNVTISRRGADQKAKIRRGIGGGWPSPPPVLSIKDSGVTKALAARAVAEEEVCSALLNLGCAKQKAREVAKLAIEQGKDFDSRLRWAIRNAA